MNWAHLHLLLNHVPVLGTIFGLALLGYGIANRSDALQKAAFGVFVAAALLALPVYFTGEPAEQVVEHAAGVSTGAIDAHEDSAMISVIAIALLGAVALGGLWVARRGRPLSAKVTGAVVVVALATAVLMARTANLGGQIHHPEIRAGAQGPATEQAEDEGH
jgi:uncharacterized membrane protein